MENRKLSKRSFLCTNGNDVHTFCIHRSRYCMTMFWSGKPKIIENMFLMYQWERCAHILYTLFPLLNDYALEWKSENYKKNIVLMYQWERCAHILYTPFLLLYDYVLEWKTENHKKIWFSCTNGNGVHTFCIHRSCYCMTMIWGGKPKIIENMALM